MTDNHLKRQKKSGVVAIATSIAACSFVFGMFLQLKTNKPFGKPPAEPAPANQSQGEIQATTEVQSKSEVNVQLQQPAKVETQNLTFSVPPKFQGKIVYQVQPSSNEKVIALTIDDGPWQQTTLQTLDILKKNDVKATFFWIGQALQKNPEIAKRVVAEGHAIGNQTWHHRYKRMDKATAKSEIENTAELIDKTTGVKTSLFRPPGGFLNNGLATYAKSQKYTVVMWSLTSADTAPRAKPQAVVNHILKNAKPGSIVLMQDSGGDRKKTVRALPQIISGLKKQGYRFVTIPELLEMQK